MLACASIDGDASLVTSGLYSVGTIHSAYGRRGGKEWKAEGEDEVAFTGQELHCAGANATMN